jgi:ABC-type transport system substrate-binding protein
MFILVSTGFIYSIPKNGNAVYFFSLDAVAPEDNIDALCYLLLIKEQLSRIGIHLNVIASPYNCPADDFFGYSFYDFDLRYVEFNDFNAIQMINSFYSENGSYNYFGYHTSMDYSETLVTGKNEWLIKQINAINPPNSQERYQACWEWQYNLMDEILPCIPLFIKWDYKAFWDNLQHFNYSEGFAQSFGKMSWDGLHAGQAATNEFVLADSRWADLNPSLSSATHSSADNFITDLILDSLIIRDADFTYWPHLATKIEYISDYQIRVTLRDDIYWQNYDHFTSEPFNVHDVYFSLFIAKEYGNCNWINSFSKINSKTIDIFLNSDFYFNELDKLAELKILPEHFLNQTQLPDAFTPDITHPAWDEFSQNCFGTGLFKIHDFKENEVTILKIKPDSWRLNPLITSDPLMEYERRFGDYSNGIDTLKIRIIPNHQVRILEFEKGKLDMVTPNQEFLDKLYKFKQYLDPTKYALVKAKPKFSLIALNIRPTRAYIGDPDPAPLEPTMTKGLAVRKAIAYAINKEELNYIVNERDYGINDHPISPHFGKWLHPNIIRYCHNIDVAKMYFTAAGYYLGWCGDKFEDITLPNWEDVCDPGYKQDTISVDGYTWQILVMVSGIISVVCLIIKLRKRKSRDMNE